MYQQAMVRVIFITGMSETRDIHRDKVTSARTPEEILAKAEKAAKLAREGRDFALVAKEYSDDPESAAKGGEFPIPSARLPLMSRLVCVVRFSRPNRATLSDPSNTIPAFISSKFYRTGRPASTR